MGTNDKHQNLLSEFKNNLLWRLNQTNARYVWLSVDIRWIIRITKMNRRDAEGFCVRRKRARARGPGERAHGQGCRDGKHAGV